jgi:hypothetical protein
MAAAPAAPALPGHALDRLLTGELVQQARRLLAGGGRVEGLVWFRTAVAGEVVAPNGRRFLATLVLDGSRRVTAATSCACSPRLRPGTLCPHLAALVLAGHHEAPARRHPAGPAAPAGPTRPGALPHALRGEHAALPQPAPPDIVDPLARHTADPSGPVTTSGGADDDSRRAGGWTLPGERFERSPWLRAAEDWFEQAGGSARATAGDGMRRIHAADGTLAVRLAGDPGAIEPAALASPAGPPAGTPGVPTHPHSSRGPSVPAGASRPVGGASTQPAVPAGRPGAGETSARAVPSLAPATASVAPTRPPAAASPRPPAAAATLASLLATDGVVAG